MDSLYTALAALVALVIAGVGVFFAGRSQGKAKADTAQLNKDVKANEIRNTAERQADAAADRVRVDNSRGGLRDDDGFRRD